MGISAAAVTLNRSGSRPSSSATRSAPMTPAPPDRSVRPPHARPRKDKWPTNLVRVIGGHSNYGDGFWIVQDAALGRLEVSRPQASTFCATARERLAPVFAKPVREATGVWLPGLANADVFLQLFLASASTGSSGVFELVAHFDDARPSDSIATCELVGAIVSEDMNLALCTKSRSAARGRL